MKSKNVKLAKIQTKLNANKFKLAIILSISLFTITATSQVFDEPQYQEIGNGPDGKKPPKIQNVFERFKEYLMS
ncbi:hypothetical protein [Planctobacterium marinum]|uniref:hypothetical protein n=1 Tax=Planctobacterium marinum TaxID=1631968 RepID=UPI001E3768DF|nr:hypothetical protein [Planctobacterium marinum]MCC2607729.1 hypothetical protein [Planctobacterium marinum]